MAANSIAGDPKAFLENMFSVIFDPEGSDSDVDRFLTHDYSQYVDGDELDRRAFLDHVGALRSAVSEVRFDFEEIVVSDDLISERHVIRARKRDGSETVGEVHAFLHLRDGKVARIVEVTNVLSGGAEDADLGSRR